jgi:hypothetical protein
MSDEFFSESLLDPVEFVFDFTGTVTRGSRCDYDTFDPEKPKAQMVWRVLKDEEYITGDEIYQEVRLKCGSGFAPNVDGTALVDEHSLQPRRFPDNSGMGLLAAHAMLSEDQQFEHGKDEDNLPMQWNGFGLRPEFVQKKLLPHYVESWIGRRFRIMSATNDAGFRITQPVQYLGVSEV